MLVCVGGSTGLQAKTSKLRCWSNVSDVTLSLSFLTLRSPMAPYFPRKDSGVPLTTGESAAHRSSCLVPSPPDLPGFRNKSNDHQPLKGESLAPGCPPWLHPDSPRHNDIFIQSCLLPGDTLHAKP